MKVLSTLVLLAGLLFTAVVGTGVASDHAFRDASQIIQHAA